MNKYSFIFTLMVSVTLFPHTASSEEVCTGSAWQCQGFQQWECSSQKGCVWDMFHPQGAQCSNEPRPCSTFSPSQCGSQKGCFVVDQPSGPSTGSGCNVAPSNRVEGGWPGISKSQCESRGMCWNSSIVNTKWCFVPEGECNIKPQNRVEGGWPGISQSTCLSRGMCWNDSERGTMWCFQPK